MKKVRNQTARVHWRMGQSLLPEHFYAQEDSLREDLFLRTRLFSLPFWGVGSLSWDSFQLLRGVISIEEMTILLPSGTLIDVPGNTTAEPFNLNTAGGPRTPVYVHLDSDYDASSAGAPGDEGEDAVERVVQKISLSSNPISDTALQSFRLAEFEKTVDGTWGLAGTYLPPMVCVTRSPFFEATLRRMNAIAAAFQQMLMEEIQGSYLAGENLLQAKHCLGGLFRFRAFLANVGREINHHPFDVFEAVNNLYIDLCVLRGIEPAARVYAHEELGRCFDEVLGDLERQLRLTKTATPYVPFSRKEGLQVCVLPDAVRKARQVYWLLQKPRVGAKIDISGLKLASESRVNVVHQLALRGIPFRRIENPPFHHQFSAEVDFYMLSDGEEWDHAVREGRLGFFHRADLEQVRCFLYWRND